jgi:hypothetical protein
LHLDNLQAARLQHVEPLLSGSLIGGLDTSGSDLLAGRLLLGERLLIRFDQALEVCNGLPGGLDLGCRVLDAREPGGTPTCSPRPLD